MRVRTFRNLIVFTAAIIMLLAVIVGIIGFFRPTALPLCFQPEQQLVVCPTAQAAVAGSQPVGQPPSPAAVDDAVRQAVSPWDVALVEFIGLLGATVAATVALRRSRGTTDPYSLPAAVAMLKIFTGALTAFLGIVLVRAAFIPGLSALDSPAQIIAWSVVFGYAQQLFTRAVDKLTKNLLSATPHDPPPPPTHLSRNKFLPSFNHPLHSIQPKTASVSSGPLYWTPTWPPPRPLCARCCPTAVACRLSGVRPQGFQPISLTRLINPLYPTLVDTGGNHIGNSSLSHGLAGLGRPAGFAPAPYGLEVRHHPSTWCHAEASPQVGSGPHSNTSHPGRARYNGRIARRIASPIAMAATYITTIPTVIGWRPARSSGLSWRGFGKPSMRSASSWALQHNRATCGGNGPLESGTSGS